MNYAQESMTGIRPTGDLTIGNYAGAIMPQLEHETAGDKAAVFIAELHATTTNDPRETTSHSLELARTLIACGVESPLYSQRAIGSQVLEAQMMFNGLVTVARLLRVPTLKEKAARPESAKLSLATYPTLMAADIAVARPKTVPTGKDQLPHLELTNELFRTFNRTYGNVLPLPTPLGVEPVNILSLNDPAKKMSKSLPNGAILLADSPQLGRKKILKAVSASAPGPALDQIVGNLVTIADILGRDDQRLAEIRQTAVALTGGASLMGCLKDSVGTVVYDFLANLQDKVASVSDAEVAKRLDAGNEQALRIANDTVVQMRKVYWGEQ